jgi:hypothetical protein
VAAPVFEAYPLLLPFGSDVGAHFHAKAQPRGLFQERNVEAPFARRRQFIHRFQEVWLQLGCRDHHWSQGDVPRRLGPPADFHPTEIPGQRPDVSPPYPRPARMASHERIQERTMAFCAGSLSRPAAGERLGGNESGAALSPPDEGPDAPARRVSAPPDNWRRIAEYLHNLAAPLNAPRNPWTAR